jgi:DNA (cytosine-5)-methyltransferase 1
MAKPKTISLFTGAGGLDLGFAAAGFDNAVAVEMHPAAVRTLTDPRNRHRWGAILPSDIHSLIDTDPKSGKKSARRILEPAGLREGDADVLIGGPPCQPFSKSGYWATGDSKRLNDPRAQTLDAYFTVLQEALPKVFLLENVPGLAFNDKDEGLSFIRSRIASIQGADYSFSAAQLNAAEFGVPQARSRVFIIGCRNDVCSPGGTRGLTFKFPAPTHTLPIPVDMSSKTWFPAAYPAELDVLSRPPAMTAWDAIGHLQEEGDADKHLELRGKWASVLPTIPEGFNYLWHTPRGGGIPIWGWRTRYWSMLLKTAKDRPSWTITAQPGPAIGPFHWNNRRFSTSELKAIQTFPHDYTITGSVLEAHFQAGNAVPSALAELLARQIQRQFLGAPKTVPTPTLIPNRKPIPPPPSEYAPASTLPSHIQKLASSHKKKHPGTGRGPGAKQSANEEASSPRPQ